MILLVNKVKGARVTVKEASLGLSVSRPNLKSRRQEAPVYSVIFRETIQADMPFKMDRRSI